MKLKSIFAAVMLLNIALGFSAIAADLKLEAQLIWATSETKPADPKLKPADAEVRRKLASLPLKWTNFYEVNRQSLSVVADETKKSVLSDRCSVEVKHLGGDKVEIALFGKGKVVWKGISPLPRKEILVLGGNAPDASAWLVTLKRLE